MHYGVIAKLISRYKRSAKSLKRNHESFQPYISVVSRRRCPVPRSRTIFGKVLFLAFARMVKHFNLPQPVEVFIASVVLLLLS